MARYIDADKLVEMYERAVKDAWNKKTAPSSWADAYDCVIADIDDQPTADVVEVPEKTCSTCQCNKVCDHNKYGFENCGNYISGDFTPRAEVFEEIRNSVTAKLREEMRMVSYDEFTDSFRNGKRDAFLDVLVAITELKKKYTEGSTDGKRTDR